MEISHEKLSKKSREGLDTSFKVEYLLQVSLTLSQSWHCSQSEEALQTALSWHLAGRWWVNIDLSAWLARPPFLSWSGQGFPRWMSPWWHCRLVPHCRKLVSPYAEGHSDTISWKQCGISGTWRCRWLDWWHCLGRYRDGRRAGTRCRGRASPGRSWLPPESGRASKVRRRGSPPQPASLSPNKMWTRKFKVKTGVNKCYI